MRFKRRSKAARLSAALRRLLGKHSAMLRITCGALVAPLVYVAFWSAPVIDHSAFSSWVILNSLMAYFVFLVVAGLTHLGLKRLHANSIWAYCLLMFAVAAVLEFLLSIGALSGYTSLYYNQTTVVQNHKITQAGYLLQVRESLAHGAISALAMAVFWLLAVFRPRGESQHA
jgi:hypothetical protein